MVLVPAISVWSIYKSNWNAFTWLEFTSRYSKQQQHQEQQQEESMESTTSFNVSTDPPQSTTTPQQQTHRHAPFPRWADPHGIDLLALILFVEHELDESTSSVDLDSYTKLFFPTPYIISASGITASSTIRNRYRADYLLGRVDPAESLYLRAWYRWSQAPHQWPNITRALANHGSFPIAARYDDFQGCNYHNWHYDNLTMSIPVFTTCAHVDCDYAWPQPTYQTIDDAKLLKQWNVHFRAQAKKYPWESKYKQVLWRGSLTGNQNFELNVRWAAARLAHTTASPLWDIGLYAIPPERQDAERNLSDVGGLKKAVPRNEFAKYRAVLDMDGNSWSSRFGRLLCDNSVVLKVFHFQQKKHGQYELQAGKHYLPVYANLSNLMEQTEFVMDPRNDAAVRAMVQNAQDCCRSHLTPARLEEDMLDIWEAYVGHLDRWRPDWSDVWQREQHRWSGPAFNSVTLCVNKTHGMFDNGLYHLREKLGEQEFCNSMDVWL
jgi:hypothetical protein